MMIMLLLVKLLFVDKLATIIVCVRTLHFFSADKLNYIIFYMYY